MSSPQQTKSNVELFHIEAELARHKPWNFIKGFCYTIDEHDKLNPVKKFPNKLMYRIAVRAYEEYDVLFIEKSRQIMISWLYACLMLHDAMFYRGRRNVLQSKKQDDSNALIDRARHVYQELQKMGFPGLPRAKEGEGRIGTDEKIIFPDNKSELWSVPQGPDVFRSYTVSNVMADEVAFQQKAKRGYEAALPAITGGGKMICPSSANGKVFNWMMLYSINPTTMKPTGPNEIDSNDIIARPWTQAQLLDMEDEQFYAIPLQEVVACVPGMRFWITDQGIPCLRIHYTADPDKSPDNETGRKWIATARKRFTPDGWEREMEINYDTFEGRPVIGNWSREIFVAPCPYDDREPLHIGVDFGTQVCGAIICQAPRIQGFNFKQLRVIDELILKGSNTPQLAEKLIELLRLRYRRNFEYRDYYIYCDAAGYQTKETEADSSINTSIKIFNKAGLRTIARKISIKESTELVQTLFAQSSPAGDPGVILAQRCEYMTKVCGGGWHYPETAKFGTAGKPEKDGEYDHGGDMLRYIAANVFKISDFVQVIRKKIEVPIPIRERYSGRIIGHYKGKPQHVRGENARTRKIPGIG